MIVPRDAASAGVSTAALEAKEVTKRYGSVTALSRVSLSVQQGECMAFVGESGSGKSTLLRCFNRMVEPDEGEIVVQGKKARTLDPVPLRRGIGYVPQDGGLLPHWSVLRNVELVPMLRGTANLTALASDALRKSGLDPGTVGSRWPRELSGGQRQRVALARALAAQPETVLLDEPFGALDAITRSELQETFGSLRKRLKITCVLVTHDINEAMALADRIAVFRAGSIEQIADGATLRELPATAYVVQLLHYAGIRRAGSSELDKSKA